MNKETKRLKRDHREYNKGVQRTSKLYVSLREFARGIANIHMWNKHCSAVQWLERKK